MEAHLSKSATSRLMKKILSKSYPGIKLTVRTYNSGICVDSTDGPSSQELHEIFPCFCMGPCSLNGQPCQQNTRYSMFEGSTVCRFFGFYVTRHLSKEVQEIAFPLMPDGLLARKGLGGDDDWLKIKDKVIFDSMVDSVLATWRPRLYSPTLALVDIVPNASCHEEFAAKHAARIKAAEEQAEFARLLRSKRPRQKSTARL